MSDSSSAAAGTALTGLVLEDRDGTRLLTITIPGIVVRLVTITPVAVALGALHLVAPGTAWWPSLLVLLLAVIAAALPDSGTGLVTLAGLVSWWLLAVPGDAVWWALLVAGCCLVFHVALAHAAAGPAGATPTWAVVGRLARRCSVVLLVTTALAGVVETAEEWGEPPVVLVAITLALVGVLPWLAARRTR